MISEKLFWLGWGFFFVCLHFFKFIFQPFYGFLLNYKPEKDYSLKKG